MKRIQLYNSRILFTVNNVRKTIAFIMKVGDPIKLTWLCIFLLSAFSVSAQLNIPPKAAFDPSEAKELLAPGSSSIKGIAYTRTKNGFGMTGTKTSITRETVYLLPFTKHLAEWDAQNSKMFKNRNKRYVLSDECLQYYLSTTTDEYGNFEFKNLKPGKYLLQTKYYMTHTYDGVDVGTKAYLMEKKVEIKNENEVLDVKFANW
ncbi:hypothetical protein [Sphingobacterium ginsenosidimutans]|uniref:Carboxypeptidase regulatory-like domain-containing protein n=1 Tax=Sphingobacterium ginsenosidimutans TaxID=687845 RepID=A0ABP7ZT24_9SPHI